MATQRLGQALGLVLPVLRRTRDRRRHAQMAVSTVAWQVSLGPGCGYASLLASLWNVMFGRNSKRPSEQVARGLRMKWLRRFALL
jgi:hypothetical protein